MCRETLRQALKRIELPEKTKHTMTNLFLGIIYIMFFLSGAAGLVYQVVWVRSLTLVFGGSHLAVTAVLSTFMAGLAIGGYVIGRYVDRVERPLLLYGLLEIGIGCFALIFAVLMKAYPSVYVFLVQVGGDSPLYLSFIRVLFSVIALIVPTSLMGGTLPVLSRFMAVRPKELRNQLSFLYGINTIGAALGTLVAGFILLRFYSVTTTLYVAVLTNITVGFAGLVLQRRASALPARGTVGVQDERVLSGATSSAGHAEERTIDPFPFRLVIWGIGVSGFCALGYEVLWTRVLAIVLGANVYSFTTMLAAFLIGIALGSGAYTLWPKLLRRAKDDIQKSVSGFGIAQIIIGITALLVTIFLRDLPAHVARLHNHFQGVGIDLSSARLWSGFVLAFGYMLGPALFMGLSFPLAGRIHAEYKRVVGAAVGEVQAYNTAGAILGAATSGLVLTYCFGIERSLQMLTVINIGLGVFVLLSRKSTRPVGMSVSGLAFLVLVFLAVDQKSFRVWDPKYFAIFRSNQLDVFSTPEKIEDALQNTEVLYYGEGAESVVSSIKVKGGEQSFVTNGRVEASSHLQGQQHLFALSHLPMLLHKDPRRVLVIGLGAGMTLGAVSAHPGLDELILVEIEPKVLGVASTFAQYNHKVLDNPKLKIIFNDGRNFLLTTSKRYDVITADPIHPWFRGAGYLYTSEYFKLASERLAAGGVLCQWLPIYELTPQDLKSIVKTFGKHFKHTMLFLTQYDAELIGSNAPILIDESELDRRIASEPAISNDLKRVMMGSADDLLGYFLMGTQGMREFGADGILNTDDNVYLEFSAPFSVGKARIADADVAALMKHRESIMAYLTMPRDLSAQEAQKKRWHFNEEARDVYLRALSVFQGGSTGSPELTGWMTELDRKYMGFAPARFLRSEYQSIAETAPRLLQKTVLRLLAGDGKGIVKEISAVLAPVSSERSAVVFVDNDDRIIYGQLYVSGPGKEQFITLFVDDVLASVNAAYEKEAAVASKGRGGFPDADATLRAVREVILNKVKERENRREM